MDLVLAPVDTSHQCGGLSSRCPGNARHYCAARLANLMASFSEILWVLLKKKKKNQLIEGYNFGMSDCKMSSLTL